MHKLTQPLKWHGGKHYLAKKIIDLMPRHITYVEPYFGGGAVLLEKNPEGVGEVVNDLNGELTNFWQVLREPSFFEKFLRLAEATPFSEVEFGDCNSWKHVKEATQVDRALNFFIRCRQSRAGQFKDFATVTRSRTRRGMNEQVSSWLTAVEGLPDVHERLKRVLILNREALDVIRQMDGPETLFYVDAPYLHETRASKDVYEYEMSKEQHEKLLAVLSSVDGKFLLSGYRSELYDAVAADRDWTRHEFELPNHAAGGAEKRRMVECVWANF